MILNIHRYRFHFTAPLHIGRGVEDYGQSSTTLQSDVLYAAVIQAWAELGMEANIPKKAEESPGFALTSLFPFLKIEKQFHYFYPKPFAHVFPKSLNATERKEWKKVLWLEEDPFFIVLSGKATGNRKNIHGAYYLDKESTYFRAPFQSEIQDRNANNGESQDTVPFSLERLWFLDGKYEWNKKDEPSQIISYQGGLFALVQFENESVKAAFDLALAHLAIAGLGTDRNVGNGQFRLESEPFSLPALPESEYGVSLSLLLPPDSNFIERHFPEGDSGVGYDLLLRGGWISAPYLHLRKKQIYMLAPGSILKLATRQSKASVLGSGANLAPVSLDRPVFRHGRSLVFPFTHSFPKD